MSSAKFRTQVLHKTPADSNPPSGVEDGDSWIDQVGNSYRFVSRRFSGVDRYHSFQEGVYQYIPLFLRDAGNTLAYTQGDVYGYKYLNAVTRYSSWEVPIGERYIDGDSVTPLLLWANDTVQAGVNFCRWKLSITSLSDGVVIPASPLLTQTDDVSLVLDAAAHRFTVSELTSIPSTHFSGNKHVTIKIEREGGSDSMAGSAALVKPILRLGS